MRLQKHVRVENSFPKNHMMIVFDPAIARDRAGVMEWRMIQIGTMFLDVVDLFKFL